MAQPNLDGVRIKLHRAYRHVQDLREILAPVTQAANQPNNIVGEPDGGDPTKLVYHVKQIPTIDSMCGAVAGDALHNMRSAFDHLAWQLVLLDGGAPCQHTLFPIYDLRNNDRGNPRTVTIQPQIRRKDILDALDAVQPHQRPAPSDEPLSVMRMLDIHDKHRLLLTMITAVDIDTNSPSWGLPEGVSSPGWWFNVLNPLNDGDVVARFDFHGTPPPAEFEPNISLAITLDAGPPGHWIRIQPVADMVEGVLHGLTFSDINWHFVPLFGNETPIDYHVNP